jgi:hypothetical protein
MGISHKKTSLKTSNQTRLKPRNEITVGDDSRGVGYGPSQALGGKSTGTFSKGWPADFLSNISANPGH